MGTQAVVSVVVRDSVVLKVVVGCCGSAAPEYAKWLRSEPTVPTLQQARAKALELRLGCSECLVVMDAEHFQALDDIGPLYRETFQQRRFNPRWENGTADIVRVVRKRGAA